MPATVVGGSRAHSRMRCAQTVPRLDDSASSTVEPIDGYEAASSFQGARKGYAFKTGPSGLGYYPDNGGASKK